MINFVLRIQENQRLRRIYRIVSSVIQLIPYYVMEEFYIEQKKLDVPLGKEDSDIVILTRDDMKLLGNHEESNESTEELIRLLEGGCLCLAVKHKGEIAAYSWCDLNYLRYKGRVVALNRMRLIYLMQEPTRRSEEKILHRTSETNFSSC